MKEQKVGPDETVVSFDVIAIFISIQVQVALEVINRDFTKYVNQIGNKHFL